MLLSLQTSYSSCVKIDSQKMTLETQVERFNNTRPVSSYWVLISGILFAIWCAA
jgi:hypothetical protein